MLTSTLKGVQDRSFKLTSTQEWLVANDGIHSNKVDWPSAPKQKNREATVGIKEGLHSKPREVLQ